MTRLQTALAEGALTLSDADPRLALFRAPADYDISGLSRADLTVLQGFYPEAARWRAMGVTLADRVSDFPAALVVVPRAKELARALVAAACAAADLVIVDGQKTDGVDALWRDIRGRIGDVPAVTKGHGRLFWFPATDAFADWAMPEPRRGADGFHTLPGVFSADGADPGSQLLAQALPAKLPGRMADLGAGWGYLAQAILSREGVKSLDLVEAEALALDCARLNVADPRARFHWADATDWKAEGWLDGVVMNPPFHQGRAADPGLGRAFIAAAQRLLGRDGQLWLVANRHLPYEAALTAGFRKVETLADARGFKVLHASQPIRPRA